MTKIYRSNFIFVADRYEEWEGGRCISKGEITTEITAEVSGNIVHFEIDNIEDLRIKKSFDFEIYDEYSNVLQDRVQYIHGTSDFNPVTPILCNIFYEGDDINYVRFAMTNPDRLIEFYGYMEALGQPAKERDVETEGLVTASSVINELRSYGMLNKEALMDRAVQMYNQYSNTEKVENGKSIIEALKLFIKVLELDNADFLKEDTASLIKPKILMFIALCNYKIDNINRAYCIAKQGLEAMNRAINESVFSNIPGKVFGESQLREIISVISSDRFDEVENYNDYWSVDPTEVDTENYDTLLEVIKNEKSDGVLSEDSLTQMINVVKKVKDIYNNTGYEKAIQIAGSLDYFLVPIYYAARILAYSSIAESIPDNLTLSLWYFENNKDAALNETKASLNEDKPFAPIEKDGLVTKQLNAIYDEIRERIDSGEFQ